MLWQIPLKSIYEQCMALSLLPDVSLFSTWFRSKWLFNWVKMFNYTNIYENVDLGEKLIDGWWK